MSTLLTLHEAPAAGFETPFELLQACHQRVHRMLRLLERLALHLAQHGADAQAREAARDVQRYFDIAGPAHHEDEERHLFPRLRQQGSAAEQVLVHQLAEDHAAMATHWAVLREDLRAIAAGRASPGEDPLRDARWTAFAALYRQHIEAEETQAYPAARAWFTAEELAAAGREMAARRGQAPGGLA